MTLGLDHLQTQPGFHPGMVRVGLLGDRLVTWALVTRLRLTYGAVMLRTALVAHLETAYRFRRRGFATALMQDTLAYVREQGAHLALMHDTTGGYFARYGFDPVWPVYRVRFDTEQANALTPPLRLRQARPPDLPHVVALYEAQWGGRVAALRSRELWIWRYQADRRDLWVIVDDRDRPLGYIAAQALHDDRAEVVVSSTDAALAAIHYAGAACYDAGIPDVSWPCPPDDALIAFARDHIDLTLEVGYRLRGGWTARLIDTPAMLNVLTPEIIAQAATRDESVDASSLRLTPGPDHVAIQLLTRPDARATLSNRDFVQLIFGSLSPDALAQRDGLPPPAVAMLGLLFPRRLAALAPWDGV